MASISTLIKQIKERESREAILTMQFKKRETEIETLTSEVKSLMAAKEKLTTEEITKLEELSKREMKHKNLKGKKTVWDMLLENNNSKWEEANTLIEQMQEGVFNNRITYCENIRNFLDKYDLLLMSFGTAVEQVKVVPTQAKSESTELEELLKKVAELEETSMNLTKEAEEIEIAKKLKAKLVSEPNEGHLFASYRSSLLEMKNKIYDVEMKITKMNEDIHNKDLLIQQHKHKSALTEISTSQDWVYPHSTTPSSIQNKNSSFVFSDRSYSSEVTCVKTNELGKQTQNKVFTPTNDPKDLKNLKGFIPKIPSAALRNRVLTNARMDAELKKILS